MIITLFGLAILLVGPALIVAAEFYSPLGGLGWAWIGAVLVIAVADNLLSRRTAVIETERQVDEKLSLGTDNQVEIILYSRTIRPLFLQVKDDPPIEFETARRQQHLWLGPYQTQRITYRTVPQARGDYQFGDIHIRGRSRLALSWWQQRIPAQQQVRVYPDLLQVHRYELLARKIHLQQAGFRLMRRRGEGTEFESLRDYVPDDDFRDIDWKASARRNKPITREYEIERSQNVMLMIDAGRMMCGQLDGMSKLDYAINAALMLAYVASRQDDAVGMMVFAGAVNSFIPPRKGKAQIGRLVEELYTVQPTMTEPDYGAALTMLQSRSRKRSLVVIFTDIIDKQASRALLAYSGALYPHHLPLVVTIRDPQLQQTANLYPQEVPQVYQRAVAAGLLRDRSQALAALRRQGARVVDATPDELTVSAVNRYLDIKARQLL